MHKKELVDRVTASTEGSPGDPLTRSDVEQVVDALLDEITRLVVKGEKVQLTGFGSFSRTERNPTNPQTGAKLGPRFVPVFKAGADLKEQVKSSPVPEAASSW